MPRNEAVTAPLGVPFQGRDSATVSLYFGQQPTIDSIEGAVPVTQSEGPIYQVSSSRGDVEDEGSHRKGRISVNRDPTRGPAPVRRHMNLWQLLQVVQADGPLRNVWDVVYDILILYSLCTSTYSERTLH